MTHHSELINLIAKKIKAKIYVEIGVFNPDHNFNKIEVENKIGVDPDTNAKATACITSDSLFEILKATGGKADLIWIDGLHYADQVRKDIVNAWEILNPGGVIALHDCNPPTEKTTCIPRGGQREWCGDVYKAICQIISPDFFTVDFDYGCTVIRKSNEIYVPQRKNGLQPELTSEQVEKIRGKIIKHYTGCKPRLFISPECHQLIFDDDPISWGAFHESRAAFLNLKSVEEAVQIIESWI